MVILGGDIKSTMPIKSLVFACTAFNEAGNLHELHSRCRITHEKIEARTNTKLAFKMIISYIGSTDNSVDVLQNIIRSDENVIVYNHSENYGAEESSKFLIHKARGYDFIVMLCSDLQDPPEIAELMYIELEKDSGYDAVLAIKNSKDVEGRFMRIARKYYYKAIALSTRNERVPGAFHGFGIYRQSVIKQASYILKNSNMNVRQSLVNGSNRYKKVGYGQSARKSGKSSYNTARYILEALRTIVMGDAASSRFAIIGGTIGNICI